MEINKQELIAKKIAYLDLRLEQIEKERKNIEEEIKKMSTMCNHELSISYNSRYLGMINYCLLCGSIYDKSKIDERTNSINLEDIFNNEILEDIDYNSLFAILITRARETVIKTILKTGYDIDFIKEEVIKELDRTISECKDKEKER